jgi:hypothetical protein
MVRPNRIDDGAHAVCGHNSVRVSLVRGLGALAILMVVACGGGANGGASGAGGSGGGGAGGTSNGCAGVQASCSLGGNVCTEYAGQNSGGLGALKTACSAMSYTWATSPCNRTGAIGGCETQVAGVCQVIWEYVNGGGTDPQANCTNGGGTWLTP